MTGEGSVSLKAALDALDAIAPAPAPLPHPPVDVVANLLLAADVLAKLPGYFNYYQVGSSLIEGANPQDVDLVIHVKDVSAASVWLQTAQTDWVPCGIEDYEMTGGWAGLRKGNLNFILTEDLDWADRFERAALVCAYLRILDKETRKVVNQIIRDGRRP